MFLGLITPDLLFFSDASFEGGGWGGGGGKHYQSLHFRSLAPGFIEFFVFDYDSFPNLLSVGGYFSFSCS